MATVESSFKIEEPKVWKSRTLYADFAEKLLKENPEYWGRYSKSSRLRNYWIYKKSGNTIVEVINYERWSQIVQAYYTNAKKGIINGQHFTVGLLGKIEPRLVERNHNNPQINWLETNKQPKVLNEKGKLVPQHIIYFTDDNWVRIAWVKGKLRNIGFFAFAPTADGKLKRGFQGEFSQANKDNPMLRFSYPYYPYIPKAKAQ